MVVREEKFPSDKEIESDIENDSIYSEDARDRLLEDDELSPVEVAFMKGYDDAYV